MLKAGKEDGRPLLNCIFIDVHHHSIDRWAPGMKAAAADDTAGLRIAYRHSAETAAARKDYKRR